MQLEQFTHYYSLELGPGRVSATASLTMGLTVGAVLLSIPSLTHCGLQAFLPVSGVSNLGTGLGSAIGRSPGNFARARTKIISFVSLFSTQSSETSYFWSLDTLYTGGNQLRSSKAVL
jgi:hypothetical protein